MHSKDRGGEGERASHCLGLVPGSTGGHVFSMTPSNRGIVQKIPGIDWNTVKKAQDALSNLRIQENLVAYSRELWAGCYSDRGAEELKWTSTAPSRPALPR